LISNAKFGKYTPIWFSIFDNQRLVHWSTVMTRTFKLVSQTATLLSLLSFTQTVFSDTFYEAQLDASQVVSHATTTTGTGFATFALSTDQTQLAYTLSLNGLTFEQDVANRTNTTDVTKIHLHSGAVGAAGIHTLNIFGLPSEDDADLVVDYANNTLSGIWDASDAINSATNAPFDQTVGGTTKYLADFVDKLENGDLYLAIHTFGEGGSVAVRGQLYAVPEPSSQCMLAAVAALGLIGLRRKR